MSPIPPRQTPNRPWMIWTQHIISKLNEYKQRNERFALENSLLRRENDDFNQNNLLTTMLQLDEPTH
jgi:hypothetical protein